MSQIHSPPHSIQCTGRINFLSVMPKKIIQLNTQATSALDGNEDRFLADLAFVLTAIGREMYIQEQTEKAEKARTDV